VITCSSYANRHTVYSAATFCPVCGLRPTTDIVLELIQPHGTCWQRKTGSKRTSARALRAGGVFERLRGRRLKSVVSVLTTATGSSMSASLHRSRTARWKDSQRLVIRRADAEAALGDLAALVRGLAAS
jgi:hypothetical protein